MRGGQKSLKSGFLLLARRPKIVKKRPRAPWGGPRGPKGRRQGFAHLYLHPGSTSKLKSTFQKIEMSLFWWFPRVVEMSRTLHKPTILDSLSTSFIKTVQEILNDFGQFVLWHFKISNIEQMKKTRADKCSRSVWSFLENLDYGINACTKIRNGFVIFSTPIEMINICNKWNWFWFFNSTEGIPGGGR